MFDQIMKFFKKFSKEEKQDSKDTAKERLHLVLMQDRANVSADFMELMKQEIIEVIKKYIDVDENSINVQLTNKVNNDGTTGVPILYANIPILNVKDDTKQMNIERKINKEQEETNKNEQEEQIEKNEIVEDEQQKEEEENLEETKNNIEQLENKEEQKETEEIKQENVVIGENKI